MTAATSGLVSVIMPAYNAAAYLAEAIDSVIAQTYPSWELLIVDDGSTDGGAAIALEYAARDPARIRYLTHADAGNHGASAARNLGLAHARGEFIALLDADDVWLPEKLAEQVPILRAHPDAGLAYSRTLYWHSWTGRPEDRRRDRIPGLRVRPGVVMPPPDFLVDCITSRAAVPCTCSTLVRRGAIEASGAFEHRFRRLYTDQVFYSKLLLVTPAVAADACWAKYRQHAESSVQTAKRTRGAREARAAYLRWLESYVREQAPGHPGLRRALRRELWRSRHPWGDYLLDHWEYLRRPLHHAAVHWLRRFTA